MKPDLIHIRRYSPDLKDIWNDFVESSKNGTFLFNRDYMEYHSARFRDYSLLFYYKNKPYCLLPACIKDNIVASHAGLTYGGLIMSRQCTAEGILEVFSTLVDFLRKDGIGEFIYKPVPYHYTLLPSQEDLYALFRHDAKISVRNISSVIDPDFRIKFSNLRARMIKRAVKNGVVAGKSNNLMEFWEILETNLKQKYNALPVHSYEEMVHLASIFPQIALYGAVKDGRMIGGVLCFHTKEVVKVQYISANEEGKKSGAIDMIFDFLLNEECKDAAYFDFGTSNEDGGRYLNETLIHQKEGFGGRAICYDTYQIKL